VRPACSRYFFIAKVNFVNGAKIPANKNTRTDRVDIIQKN